MEPIETQKHFNTNPVEIVIFLAISAIFAHSVYRLFYITSEFKPLALTPMVANPLTEGRSPASQSQFLQNLEINCDSNTEQETTASKVRLSGLICGKSFEKFKNLQIYNTTNHFNATVFTDTNTKKFSTDYIPLNPGHNQIHLEFTYSENKNLIRDVLLDKK